MEKHCIVSVPEKGDRGCSQHRRRSQEGQQLAGELGQKSQRPHDLQGRQRAKLLLCQVEHLSAFLLVSFGLFLSFVIFYSFGLMVLLISFLAFLIIFGPFCLYGLFSILVSFDLFGVFWSFTSIQASCSS